VLSTAEFQALGKEAVLFGHITTQIKGRKDDDLLGRKGGKGFPYVVAMDAEGRITAALADRSVAGFQAMLVQAREQEAKRARKDLPATDAAALLEFDLSVGNLTAAEATAALAAIQGLDAAAKAKLEGLVFDADVAEMFKPFWAGEKNLEQMRALVAARKGLDAAQRKKLDEALFDGELKEIMAPVRSGTPEEKQAAGKAFAALWKDGKQPGDASGFFQPFYIFIMDHAEATKDLALFEKAFEVLRAKFGDNPNAKRWFEAQDARLKKLKGE
jgi:hypothetical protein